MMRGTLSKRRHEQAQPDKDRRSPGQTRTASLNLQQGSAGWDAIGDAIPCDERPPISAWESARGQFH
jgi:hypothetical protein